MRSTSIMADIMIISHMIDLQSLQSVDVVYLFLFRACLSHDDDAAAATRLAGRSIARWAVSIVAPQKRDV